MPDDDPHEKQPRQACPHLKKDRLYLYICVSPHMNKSTAIDELKEAVMGKSIVPGLDPEPDWDTFHLCARHPLNNKVFWVVGIKDR